MDKWYKLSEEKDRVIVASRIRLLRNLKNYPFPKHLEEEQRAKLTESLETHIKDSLKDIDYSFVTARLDTMALPRKKALTERHVINKSSQEQEHYTGLMVTEDEGLSIILNGDDHIRIQYSKAGQSLKDIWKKVDEIDDYINEEFDYAFDKSFGYMTSFPTNVGTGMRAYVLLHLPMLSDTKKLKRIIEEMSRFGIVIKNLFGEENENYSDFYLIYNQKTLGQTEEDIITLLTKISDQLATHEKKMRQYMLEHSKLEEKDIIYRAYGTLKYAVKVSLREAMEDLSQIRFGITENVIKLKEQCSIYDLAMGIQDYNLKEFFDKPSLEGVELEKARALYLKKKLPDLLEEDTQNSIEN